MNGQIVDENGWVRNYNVTLEHLGITNLRDLLTGDKQKQGVLYTLDFMFQEAFKRQSDLKGYDTYGWRAFYNFQLGRGELGHGVEYFRGFSQSLRPTQMGLSLNLIDKATAFYKPICVLDFISELLDGRSLDRPFSADERTKVDDALENVLVETHLEKSAYKRYKFDKLTPEGTTQLTTRGKQKTGLFEYYKEKHKCTLLYPHLPSILVKIRSEKIHRHTCPLRFVGSPRSKDTRSVLIRFRCLVWEISLRRGRRISSIISYKP